jgi:Allophanate hydrolase C-terminal domain
VSEIVRMFVNGEAMSGGRLHANLRAATFCGPCGTAPRYRFFSVRDEFPGLHPVAEGGASVPGELYEVSYETLRESLLPAEPPELELGIIELADGSGSLSMRMRAGALTAAGVADITGRGGWLRYLASIGKAAR